MKTTRLAVRSVMEYIKELMESAGFPSDGYTVIDIYPNQINNDLVFPVITVGSPFRSSEPVQLSSMPRKVVRLAIDIIANSENQQQDIADVMQEGLEDQKLIIYNFSSGFPPTTGDYSGIPQVGEMYISAFSSISIYPAVFEKIEEEKFHELIYITLKLPLINV